MRARCTSAVLTAFALLAATEAEAAADKPRRPATALERGEREFAHGRWASARPELADAYARTRNARALWLLAACDMRLEDWPSAATELAAYVSAKSARRDLRGRAERLLIPEVRLKVAEIIVSLPPGAAYAIDGGPSVLADAHARVFVAPGLHRVHILAGARDAMVTIDVGAGASTTMGMPAEDLPSSVLLATALGGASADPEAPSPAAEPPRDADADVASPPTITPTPRPATAFDPIGPRASTGKAPLVISLTAAAIGAAAFGTYFALEAAGTSSQAATLRRDSQSAGRYCAGANGGGACAEAMKRDGQASDERAAAIGLFAGAVAFGTSALVTYLVWPSAAKTVTVGASVSPHELGAGATIRF